MEQDQVRKELASVGAKPVNHNDFLRNKLSRLRFGEQKSTNQGSGRGMKNSNINEKPQYLKNWRHQLGITFGHPVTGAAEIKSSRAEVRRRRAELSSSSSLPCQSDGEEEDELRAMHGRAELRWLDELATLDREVVRRVGHLRQPPLTADIHWP
ncbi:hypothetical protein EJB05_03109, partial [Eragrostis curvula]